MSAPTPESPSERKTRPGRAGRVVDDAMYARRERPASVWLALAALGVVFGIHAVLALPVLKSDKLFGTPAQMATFLGLEFLILAGLFFRHRLAWMWGRVLAVVGALFNGYLFVKGLIDGVHEDVRTVHWLLGVQCAALIAVYFALGTDRARVYFRLVCPQCRKFTNRAADFFFQRARCKECDNQW